MNKIYICKSYVPSGKQLGRKNHLHTAEVIFQQRPSSPDRINNPCILFEVDEVKAFIQCVLDVKANGESV